MRSRRRSWCWPIGPDRSGGETRWRAGSSASRNGSPPRPGSARRGARRRATRRRADARGLPARREPGRAGGPDRGDRPPAGAAPHGGRALLPGRPDLRRGRAAAGPLGRTRSGAGWHEHGTSLRRRLTRRGMTLPAALLAAGTIAEGHARAAASVAAPRLSRRFDDPRGAGRPGRRGRRGPGPRGAPFHGPGPSPIGRARPHGRPGQRPDRLAGPRGPR